MSKHGNDTCPPEDKSKRTLKQLERHRQGNKAGIRIKPVNGSGALVNSIALIGTNYNTVKEK